VNCLAINTTKLSSLIKSTEEIQGASIISLTHSTRCLFKKRPNGLKCFWRIATNFTPTVGPRYMRQIGTKKFGLQIKNLHIKRPRITVNRGIRSRKMANLQAQIREFADKKTAYNKVYL
jgi:hypothetical protein